MQVTPHGGLANRCTRPLCDLSVAQRRPCYHAVRRDPGPLDGGTLAGRPSTRGARRDRPVADAAGPHDEERDPGLHGRRVDPPRAPIDLAELRPGVARPVRPRGGPDPGDPRATACVEIEHTGSTSVPGLAAKPIIDITLVVADSSDEPACDPGPGGGRLPSSRSASADWFEHRVFKGPTRTSTSTSSRPGCAEIERMVGFRDWLRTHRRRSRAVRGRRSATSRPATGRYVQNYADAQDRRSSRRSWRGPGCRGGRP